MDSEALDTAATGGLAGSGAAMGSVFASDCLLRLHRVSEALSAELAVDEVAATIVREGSAAVRASAGAVFLLSPRGSALELVHAAGYDPVVAQRLTRIPLDTEMPATDAARSGRPAFVGSIREWEDRYTEPPMMGPVTRHRAWAALPLRSGDRVAGALSLSFREPRHFDVTQRRFLEALGHQCAQALRRSLLYERAVRATREHLGVLSMLVHEMRSPLTAIVGFGELLDEELAGPLTDQQRDFVERIRSSGEDLRLLADDLSRFTQLESASERLHEEWFALDGVVAEVLRSLAPMLRVKRVRVEARCAPAPIRLYGDRYKTRQVLTNVIAAAVRLSRATALDIETETVDGWAAVELREHDRASGERRMGLARILQQSDEPEAMLDGDMPPNGFGLWVARRLAAMMGGGIDVRQREGGETTVRVRLPLPDPAPAGEQAD